MSGAHSDIDAVLLEELKLFLGFVVFGKEFSHRTVGKRATVSEKGIIRVIRKIKN